MAATTDVLTTQIHNRFYDDTTSIQERLDVAKKVFSSPTLPVPNKEEQVLFWIMQILQDESTGIDVRKICYDTLLYCFKSNRMKYFNKNISTSLVTELVELMKYVEDFPEDLNNTMRDCRAELVSIPCFQRSFICDISCGCKLVGEYLKSINSKESTKDFISVLDQYLYIHNTCVNKVEKRYNFVKEIFIPLSMALDHSPKENTSAFYDKASYVFRQVILSDYKFIEGYVNVMTHMPTTMYIPPKDVKYFTKKIKHLPTKCDPLVVEKCFSLFLLSLTSHDFGKNYDKLYKVFYLMTHPLGIIVQTNYSIETKPIDNWDMENSFVIITKLVKILEGSRVSLHFSVEGTNLAVDWFASLVIGLCNINRQVISNNLFVMITKVLEFNPLAIEKSIKAIIQVMLLIKSPELKENYIRLIKVIINGSSKVKRFQKTLSLFLSCIKESLMESCEENLLLEDVLPREVAGTLTQAFSQLPYSLVLSSMKALIFHLGNDCLPLVEASQTDTSVCINMELISEITYCLIQGTNIVDHNVPNLFKDKFKSIFEELQTLLMRFGVLFYDFHEDRLLHSYLLLCRSFGAVKLLFREYDNIEIVAATDVDLPPYNLSYVHSYLYPDYWKNIVLQIENHEECGARNELFELLIQKSEALSQVEEGYEGPGTQAARYILNHADVAWMWDHLTVLSPLFQSAELIVLVRKIIDHFEADQSSWIPLLKEESFSENRRLVLACGHLMMLKASKEFCLENSEDEPISYQVLSLLDHCNLLEYELSQLIRDDFDLKEGIEESLEEMANLLNEKLEEEHIQTVSKVPHSSLFEVTARLPLHHFSVTNQCCVLLAALAILYQLTPGSDAELYMFNLLLKIIDGPKKVDRALLGKLNPGIFLRFIAARGKNYPGQRKLMKRICLNSFQNKYASKKLFKVICDPTSEDLWVTALVVDSLTLYKKKWIGSVENNRKPLERKACLEYLTSSILPVLCSEKPSIEHLYSYAVVFRYAIQTSNGSNGYLQQLTPILKDYIDFAFADYKTGFLLIESMIKHRDDLDDKDFPTWLTSHTLQMMKSELMEPQESASHLILEISTLVEFQEIVTALLSDTENEIKKEIWDFRIRNLFCLWCHLASTILSSAKSAIRDDALASLLVKLPMTLASRWDVGNDYDIIPLIIELISTVAKNTSVSLRPVALDSYLILLQVIPLPQNDGLTLVSHLNYCMNAMFELYLFRTSLLIDRLPPFMQLYRKYLVALAPFSKSTETEEVFKISTSAADKLERLATTLVKKNKDLARLSPYVIADLMSVFQQVNLYSDVKFSYTNIAKTFISICDKHAISYLNAVLPLGQQELFNDVYENYNKYCRFVGKI